VTWFEENTDAEYVEQAMGKCLAVVGNWCKECLSALPLFGCDAALKLWGQMFFVGLEACLPLDADSPLRDTLSDCKHLPYIFNAKMTLDIVETKMAMISIPVFGVAPSVAKVSDKAKVQKKKSKSKEEMSAAAVTAFKDQIDADAAPDTDGAPWIDTLKTAILSPFELLKERYNGSGECSTDVATTTIRMGLHHVWTEACPNFTNPTKRWGFLRKAIIDIIVSQHPQAFNVNRLQSAHVVSAGSESMSDDLKVSSLDLFMRDFATRDPASLQAQLDEDHGGHGLVAEAPAAPKSDKTDKASSRLEVMRVFSRMYYDQSMILRLTNFAADCNLKVEWGYQVMPQLKDFSKFRKPG
jgi:hypothetical protein